MEQENEVVEPVNMMFSGMIDDFFLNKRRIILNGEINADLSLYVTSHLQFFAYISPDQPVFIYITSGGGDTAYGQAIVDQMLLSPFPVYTIVRGHAESMAAMIAMNGSDACRFMTKDSYMMIHPVQCSPLDPIPLREHNVAINHYMKHFELQIKKLSKKTKISYKKLTEIINNTTWFMPKEAIKLGLVDGIWDKNKEQESIL